MLFDAAAVLSTSVALSPAAEAFIDREISSFSTSIAIVVDSVGSDILTTGKLVLPESTVPKAAPAVVIADPAPSPATSPTESKQPNQVTTSPVLQQLSELPTSSLAAFVADNPAAIASVLAAPPAAREVTVWWRALGVKGQTSLMQAAPQLVGNLEGVPYSKRNLANRSFLQSSIEELQATIDSNQGRLVVEEARRTMHMLQEVHDALGTNKSVPARTLLTLDVTGAGRAAIVLGDLRSADYVSYLIPGMFFTVDGQIGDWTDAAARLYDDQVSWLKLLADDTNADATVATVAWLGYETPNLTNIGGLDNAYVGRDLIATAVEGLQTMRIGDEPYVSLLAHSYGSTAALMALTEYDFEVDALAMVGSPGSAAQSVNELNVRNGNVWVGEAGWDPVPNSAFFGSDPGSASYGAKPMGVGGGLDMITHELLAGSLGHNEYFGPNTESMRNLALIGIDKGQFVSSGLDTQQAKAFTTSW